MTSILAILMTSVVIEAIAILYLLKLHSKDIEEQHKINIGMLDLIKGNVEDMVDMRKDMGKLLNMFNSLLELTQKRGDKND